MELELVTFEQAKALKEFGFPQSEKHKIYTVNDSLVDCVDFSYIVECLKEGRTPDEIINAPSLELAAKWLREEKDIIIQPCSVDIDDYLLKLLVREYDSYDECYTLSNKMYELVHYNSWEEALSAGIDKAIKLLKEE